MGLGQSAECHAEQIRCERSNRNMLFSIHNKTVINLIRENDYIVPGGRIYEQREYVYKALTDIPGISAVKPQAAFYMFPKIEVIQGLKDLNFLDVQFLLLFFLVTQNFFYSLSIFGFQTINLIQTALCLVKNGFVKGHIVHI